VQRAINVSENRSPQVNTVHYSADACNISHFANPVPIFHHNEETVEIITNYILSSESNSQTCNAYSR